MASGLEVVVYSAGMSKPTHLNLSILQKRKDKTVVMSYILEGDPASRALL